MTCSSHDEHATLKHGGVLTLTLFIDRDACKTTQRAAAKFSPCREPVEVQRKAASYSSSSVEEEDQVDANGERIPKVLAVSFDCHMHRIIFQQFGDFSKRWSPCVSEQRCSYHLAIFRTDSVMTEMLERCSFSMSDTRRYLHMHDIHEQRCRITYSRQVIGSV